MRHARVTGPLGFIVLTALGALVLHQARYLVGHGGDAAEALTRDGHAHMSLALPITFWMAVALVISTLVLASFARPSKTRAGGRDPRIRAISCALVLLGIFCAQELIEGAVSASHPGGIEALVGHGGAAALPLAIVVGCLLSLLVELLGSAEERVAGSRADRRIAPAVFRQPLYLEPDVERLAALGLVFGFARRPPPSRPAGG